MERCPACRARLNNNAVCQRCDCDLSLVFTAQSQSVKALQQAMKAIVSRRPELASRQAMLALSLDVNPMTVILHRYLRDSPSRKAVVTKTVSIKADQLNQTLKSLRLKMLKRFN